MNRWELLYVAGTLAIILMPIFVVFVGSGKHWRAAQESARERRIAEAKMNAPLLRLNI